MDFVISRFGREIDLKPVLENELGGEIDGAEFLVTRSTVRSGARAGQRVIRGWLRVWLSDRLAPRTFVVWEISPDGTPLFSPWEPGAQGRLAPELREAVRLIGERQYEARQAEIKNLLAELTSTPGPQLELEL